ncbi:brefeldin A-inhibited guanine nucleotide-exchange 2-like [Olea europaea subsp. europaea]|uniref:Brefeldin A-inhibited guanine nucleotide-exchange 2-like n=1 Tax=Olea europaea subsp. europaea TaxID=158383 RepID=A0A8S0Q8L3_OLEEU|nr:brefeldin A-inhibited guanine nucleotide-exchange 2-like [Olea europaea subsp. europaea]
MIPYGITLHLSRTIEPVGTSNIMYMTLTRNLACEWAKDGIRVNCIAPWYIKTSLVEHNLVVDRHLGNKESEVEFYLVNLCMEVLQSYIETAYSKPLSDSFLDKQLHWKLPPDSGRRRELAARAPLIVATLQAMCSLDDSSFVKNLLASFP